MAVSIRSIRSRVHHIRSESEEVWSEAASRRPPPELHGQVRGYTGYEERARDVRTLREIPSGGVTLIVNFGPALAITDPGADKAVLRRSFVAGVHDAYAVTQVPRRQHGLEIQLTPVGAYTLLGQPMSTLANRAVALEEVLGSAADELAERLHALPDWHTRFDLLDRALAWLLGRGRAPSASTVWAWRRLVESEGRLPIAKLAAELGVTRKHIAERFREEVGVPPKTLARVLRFRHAVRLLHRDELSLAEVASRCGYFDQAHLNRDFREFAGVTPRQLAPTAPVAAAP